MSGPRARFAVIIIGLCVVIAATALYVGLIAKPQPAPQAAGGSWDALVAAAQKEGTVQVSGPRGLPEFKKILTDDFTSKYGIQVSYTDAGADVVLKQMLDTPASSAYPWDVLVGGFDTLLSNLQPKGALAPMEPALVLPEAKDPSKWAGNQLPWVDSAHTALGFLKQAGQYFYIDSSKVNLDDIKTYRDFLDPKWRGQILLTGDPRDPGHGRSVFALFLQSPGLGEPFIRDLVSKQDLVIPKNNTDDADRYLKDPKFLMCICNNGQGTALTKSFPNFKKLNPHNVKEGTSTTSSFSNLAMPARVAHPNAAKLYVNWILSQEVGQATSKATGVPSVRVDVAKDFIPAASVPDPSWPSGSDETALAKADEASKLAVQILGPKDDPRGSKK